MAEGKMVCPTSCCANGYMLFGILAIVYGIIVYMMDVMGWQPYMAWIVGGVILLLVGWAKGAKKS